MNSLAKQTNVPGKFTYTSQRECSHTHTHTHISSESTGACKQHAHDVFPSLLSGWGSENDMRWVDVKYDEYALTHTIKTKAGVNTVVNKLYGKATMCH